jgi:serine/threonine protein kinase
MKDPTHPEEVIFEAAFALPASERAAYLDRACAGNDGLRQLVEALLEAHEEAGEFLESPAPGAEPSSAAVNSQGAGGLAATASASIEKPGDRIGRYKLLEQIGEGGCGVVYMAEQEEPVRRKVALKVIKLGMDTKSVIARFEAERQALALMDHPNIARVLDVGATETGRPYFVMELVKGFKITDYCDQNNLPTHDRLGLFVQICQAIQHAHQKGVIHRDLKPSNILVTLYDGVPVPKVIDFGIAKATSEQRLTDRTVFTHFAQFIGTPAYMSPEQAEMSALRIDTRSDIYSLGVLLYELLTGRTPFDTKDLLQAGLDEIRRIIREQEPVRPSTRLSTMVAGELTAAAQHRRAAPPRLIHLVRGDLDWIVMKALEKERARRYETANGLAMDVQRYLTDEPVVARPPSRAYRLQKMVRRNKLMFGAIAAVLAALIAGFGVSTCLFIQEKAAKRAAITEAAKSEQAFAFLQNMLDGVGPATARGRDTVMMREILENTERQMGEELKGEPQAEALLRSTIAGIYEQLGDYPRAEEMMRKALQLEQSSAGKDDPAMTELFNGLGLILRDRGDLLGAVAANREVLARLKRLPELQQTNVARALNNLALAQWSSGDLAGAIASFNEAVLRQTKLGERDTTKVASVLANLALMHWELGDLAEAESAAHLALALRERTQTGKEDPAIGGPLNTLGLVLRDRGDLAGAETVQRQALALMTKIVGSDHPNTVWVRKNLATTLRRRGGLAGNADLLREALQLNPTDALTGDALADMLAGPSLQPVAIASQTNPTPWRYTLVQPASDWPSPGFSDATWRSDPALASHLVYSPRSEHASTPLTNFWLRRELDLADLPSGKLVLRLNRSQDGEVILNGVPAAPSAAWSDTETLIPCWDAGRAALTRGRNVLAIHCRDADGGASIGVGLYSTQDATVGRKQLISEFDRWITSQPSRADLYAGRASAFARLGRWKKAGADLTKAVELNPSTFANWYQLAPLLVETADLPAYQRLRLTALDGFTKAADPNVAARGAVLGLLVATDGPPLQAAAALADRAAVANYADAGLASRQWAKGLAEYRQDRFALAIVWLDKSLATGARPDLPGWNHERERNRAAAIYLVQAMAHQRLKHPTDAAIAMTKGAAIVQNQFPQANSGDLGREWPEWLIAHIVLREAKSLIEGFPAAK